MKTMQTMGTMKGIAGVLALVFAASLLVLLPGCQAPAGPQADPTGTVSLTIGHVGRAIQPDIGLGGFTGGFTATFTRAGHDSVTVSIPAGGTTAQVELPQGGWGLTVNALIGTVVAATYSREALLNVGPGFTGVTATLSPIFTGGDGTFSWALTVPAGATGNLEVRIVDEHGAITSLLYYTPAFDVSINPTLWGANLTLPAGAYFVRFVLDHDTYGRAILSSDLHVYQGMTSNITRTLTYAHFRLDLTDTVIGSAAVTVTAPAFGETPDTVAAIVGADPNFNVGAVAWTPDHGTFRGGTEYTATVVLMAHPGYTFTGGLTTATINGQAATVTNNTGLMATLAFEFQPTEPDPVMAAWKFGTAEGGGFENNPLVSGSIESGNASRPSGGQQAETARLRFWVSQEGVETQRALNAASSGINVLNAAIAAVPPVSGGLDGLAGNAWWKTYVSTVDRADIAVTWRMRSTNTGPRDWRLQYRVGSGGAWNSVGGAIALPSGPDASTLRAPAQGRLLPASAEGHDRLYLRWLMTSNFSAGVVSGVNTVAPAGTHQINDLAIFSGADPAEFDNRDDQTGAFNVTWTGFSNPLLADGVTITGSAAGGTISIAPENAFTSIQWLDGSMQEISNTATLSLDPADFPPLVTVRVRTDGSDRTYSIVFDTATGAVF